MGKLTGKKALVTGAARGLGREYALRLASLGADVGIMDINLHSYKDFEGEAELLTADTVMDEIKAMGVNSVGYECDITDRIKVAETIEKIAEDLGGLDIVVCNAGGGSGKTSENAPGTMDFDQFDMVIDRNLKGTLYTVNAAAKIMKEQKSGKIITVSSHVGTHTGPGGGYSHYGMAKAAIIYMTKAAARELGEYGVTVNCIAPGYISTGRMSKVFSVIGTDSYVNQTSLGRMGTPEDCAKVIEFLATDLSDFVTGEVIMVTGGTTERLV